LVNLCNVCAIAYTGLARIEGSPTHEWIAKTLAAANCADTGTASEVLASHATEAFAKIRPSLRKQSFLLTGWASFDGMSGLRPHLGIITNFIDEQGRHIAQAKAKFDRRFRALLDGEEFVWTAVGEPLRVDRQQQFARNLRKMIAKKMGPQELLRLMVDEIAYTSVRQKCPTVGAKILGVSIPKTCVERQSQSGFSAMMSLQPQKEAVTFTYFQPGYSELQQYGPTLVFGEFAFTDIETRKDLNTDYQSIGFKILAGPKSTTSKSE